MRRTAVYILGGLFVLLLIGLFFTVTDSAFPTVEQVSDPEGSSLQVTSEEGTMLAVLVLVIPALVIGMGVAMYALFWFLNREVKRVEQQPAQPVKLLDFRGGEGTANVSTALADNALMLIIGAGAVMLIIVVALLVLA